VNLVQVFALTSERIPGKVAIKDDSTELTYRQWSGDVYALANSFRQLGMVKGERVAIIMANSIAHATATAAVVTGGGVSVPFNVRAAPTQMAHVVRDSGARIVVLDDASQRADLLHAGIGPDSVTWVTASRDPDYDQTSVPTIGDLVAEGTRYPPLVPIGDGDLANLLYTSGTTGAPKGIPHNHGSIVERVIGWVMHFGPVASGGVRSLGVAPLYHITGYHCVFWLTIMMNGSYHLPISSDPEKLLGQIEADRISFIAAPPVVLDRLVTAASGQSFDLTSVDTVVPGSAPRPPHLVDALVKTFPRAKLGEAYGNTEGVMFGGVDLLGKSGAFQVIGDMVARVIRPGGSPDDVVGDGEQGELIVSERSARLISSYWNRPEEEAQRFRHGWNYTGDAARRDDEGDVWVIGRLDDMFISGAENIQPTEVEEVLDGHALIADCAVVGTPHDTWGEVCTAFIVRADASLTVDDIDQFCRDSADLADFKRPRRYIFVENIERNATGKILRGSYRSRWVIGRFETLEPIP
jgi:acyl-CoA synthetase (AMP-forming)/AMP-acid ligase II